MKKTLRKAGPAAGLFFVLTSLSFATTFGPINVVDQASNSQYYVYGKVVGAAWSEMEPRLQRPYTYWRVSVAEQLYGNPVATDLVLRQPGGEIGELGYRVAGAAEFAGGEEVFVALRDTDQASNVKEVVGLASGKYRVEKDARGERVVMSALGLPVSGDDGRPMDPEAFKALLRRIANKEITEADRNVFVSRKAVHDIDTSPATRDNAETAALVASLNGNNSSSQTQGKSVQPSTTDKPLHDENRVQENAPGSEEWSTGSVVFWIVVAALLLGLLAGLVYALRR